MQWPCTPGGRAAAPEHYKMMVETLNELLAFDDVATIHAVVRDTLAFVGKSKAA